MQHDEFNRLLAKVPAWAEGVSSYEMHEEDIEALCKYIEAATPDNQLALVSRAVRRNMFVIGLPWFKAWRGRNYHALLRAVEF